MSRNSGLHFRNGKLTPPLLLSALPPASIQVKRSLLVITVDGLFHTVWQRWPWRRRICTRCCAWARPGRTSCTLRSAKPIGSGLWSFILTSAGTILLLVRSLFFLRCGCVQFLSRNFHAFLNISKLIESLGCLGTACRCIAVEDG